MLGNNSEEIKGLDSVKVVRNHQTCWSARAIMPLLGYEKWERFSNVIHKAQVSCANSGQLVENHFFPDPGKSEGGRPSEDFQLSKYACYLVAQNGDPRKPEVAFAQTYFATQTIRQESYDQLSDIDKRLYVRTQVKEGTKRLNSSAKLHGVINYAFFHNAGYRGLYGMFISDIKKRKGLTQKDDLLDNAGTTELAANLFRVTQTEERLNMDAHDGRRHGQKGAETVHYEIGNKVRRTIAEIGGKAPENLPAEEDIKKLGRIGRLKSNQRSQ